MPKSPINNINFARGIFRIIGYDWIKVPKGFPFCSVPNIYSILSDKYPILKCLSQDSSKLMYLPLDELYVYKIFEDVVICSVGEIHKYDERYAGGTYWYRRGPEFVKGYFDDQLFELTENPRQQKMQHRLFVEHGSIHNIENITLDFLDNNSLTIKANGTVNVICRELFANNAIDDNSLSSFVKSLRNQLIKITYSVPFNHFYTKEYEIKVTDYNSFDARHLCFRSHMEQYRPLNRESFLRDLEQHLIYETPVISAREYKKCSNEKTLFGRNFYVPVCDIVDNNHYDK